MRNHLLCSALLLSSLCSVTLLGCNDSSKEPADAGNASPTKKATVLTGACLEAYELSFEERDLLFKSPARESQEVIIEIQALKEGLLYATQDECKEKAMALQKSITILRN